MCGRHAITLPPEAIRQLFQTHGELPNWLTSIRRPEARYERHCIASGLVVDQPGQVAERNTGRQLVAADVDTERGRHSDRQIGKADGVQAKLGAELETVGEGIEACSGTATQARLFRH